MRAARLHQYNEVLTGGDVLSVETVADPEIRRPDEVIVRVGGAGLCRTDLHLIQGIWRGRISPSLPHTPGHENAGWVEAIGPSVSTFQVGDPVILHPLITDGLCAACRRGDDMRCEHGVFPGLDADGGFAELILTRERNLVRCPEGAEPASVAPHADAGLTAYRAVKRAIPSLRPGSVAVVIGLGGLGHVALQLLQLLTSSRCIVVDKSEAALELGRTLGAAASLPVSSEVVDEVIDLTHGVGAHVVFDFVGEDASPETGIAMTRAGGQYYVIGYGGELRVPTIEMISMEKSLMGSQVGTFSELQELMELVGTGKIRLDVQTYELTDVNRAIRDLANASFTGRAVLIP